MDISINFILFHLISPNFGNEKMSFERKINSKQKNINDIVKNSLYSIHFYHFPSPNGRNFVKLPILTLFLMHGRVEVIGIKLESHTLTLC